MDWRDRVKEGKKRVRGKGDEKRKKREKRYEEEKEE